MQRYPILILVFFLLPGRSFAQTNPHEAQHQLTGTKIQKVTVTDFLQNMPADTAFSKKFKVLEFWATWCKPCLAAVPHINKLQETFKDSNLVFLSVTYESPEVTARTLQKVKFKTIVVSDQTKTIHKDLRIEYDGQMALPRTVLIDDNNTIVWYGTPKKLTAAVIRKFLKKEKLN